MLSYTRTASSELLKPETLQRVNQDPNVKLMRYSQNNFDQELADNPFEGTNNLRGKSPRSLLRIDPRKVKLDFEKAIDNQSNGTMEKDEKGDASYVREKETENIAQGVEEFRDQESGRKKKATTTKFTRDKEKTEVKDDGIDPAMKAKFEQHQASGIENQDWFKDMMKESESKFSKFRRENQEKFAQKEELFSKFWEDRASKFQRKMEDTSWGMKEGAASSSDGDVPCSDSNASLNSALPPRPDSKHSDSKSEFLQKSKSEKSETKSELHSEAKSETKMHSKSSASDFEFGRHTRTLDTDPTFTSGLGSYRRSNTDFSGDSMFSDNYRKSSFQDRMGKKEFDCSDSFDGLRDRMSHRKMDAFGDMPSTGGKPQVTRKVNTYQYSSSKTSFECR